MTKPFRADLHCHSTCSDGSMSPRELVFHAKAVGLSGLCITDHDTIAAYMTAIEAAKLAGILLGSGVEFSSVHEGISVHVLGYDVDLSSPALKELCDRHVMRRKKRNETIVKKLAEGGMPIDLVELEEGSAEGRPMGRPHIAQALLKKGYVKTFGEAFQKYIGDGRPFFDPGEPISTEETLAVIHEARGKAFIAHPHLMEGKNKVLRVLELPFDGLECFYSKCLPVQEKKWVEIAEEKGLLISGGSDFHGKMKQGIPLGSSWVDRETFEKIFEKNLCL